MSSFKITPKTTAVLKQENRHLNASVELLQARIKSLQEFIDDNEQQQEEQYDVEELRCRLKHMRSVHERELQKLKRLQSNAVRQDARDLCKTPLLDCLEAFQLLKWKLACVEVHCIEYLIWKCETEGYEDRVQNLQETIDELLEGCEDIRPGFMCDAITDTLASKGSWLG